MANRGGGRIRFRATCRQSSYTDFRERPTGRQMLQASCPVQNPEASRLGAIALPRRSSVGCRHVEGISQWTGAWVSLGHNPRKSQSEHLRPPCHSKGEVTSRPSCALLAELRERSLRSLRLKSFQSLEAEAKRSLPQRSPRKARQGRKGLKSARFGRYSATECTAESLIILWPLS